ncbi:EAL domain-containing protein, partial [Klebsiella quasipneumoniae subsp. similipneumoniae]
LVAVECLSRFDNLPVSPEYFFRHATAAVRERIFLEQLGLIEQHKAWFLRNHISATINVDDHILTLLRQKEIKEKIAALTCVHFEVTENAEKLLNNSLAAWQSPQDTSLWLDDFGSGYAGINAISGYHFDYVKIDKDFFWHLMRKESGRQLMDALVTFLSRNHHNVIIEGVESEA